MALYKLCSTNEEHKKLQQNYTELTGNDGSPIQIISDPFSKMRENNGIDHKTKDSL